MPKPNITCLYDNRKWVWRQGSGCRSRRTPLQVRTGACCCPMLLLEAWCLWRCLCNKGQQPHLASCTLCCPAETQAAPCNLTYPDAEK